jgi:hypothetical protein
VISTGRCNTIHRQAALRGVIDEKDPKVGAGPAVGAVAAMEGWRVAG